MPGPVFIRGEDVDLRPIEDADVEFLQKAANHPDVRRYAGGDVPVSRSDVGASPADDVVELLVCDGDTPVGDVSLAPIDERRGWANLGYWINPEHWGEGYATEAARLTVTHGFEELRLHRISATIHADNEASKRVVENLGFVHEGTKRDDDYLDGAYVDRDVYAVLRDEWTGESRQ
jgi:Acetyltransferases, including N-acetylases of ribosomal proteins